MPPDSTSTAYFISDAHLGMRSHDFVSLQDRLIQFLRDIRGEASHLFIAGDFFDFWIEYRALIRREYFPVLLELSGLVQSGVEVHYIAGNHDFALGDFLSNDLGIIIHKECFIGELQGKRIHVRHGDGFAKADLDYKLLRAVLRSPISQFLYRMIHPSPAIAFAEMLSGLSRKKSGGTISPEKEALYRERAESYLLSENIEILVLGHTHKAVFHDFAGRIYCNTGEWLKHPSFARLHDGHISLWKMDEAGNFGRMDPIISG